MSERSSRADTVPHTKISAAMIARSATVTGLPFPAGASQAAGRPSKPDDAR
jgi:hypothetical protein